MSETGTRPGGRSYGVRDRFALLLILTVAVASGCDGKEPSKRLQGYVEGEFIAVAPPLSGTLEELAVARGARVAAGDVLFVLERAQEQAAVAEAEGRLAKARATLEDARKGRRPSEIEALRAQVEQARAALRLSEKEYERQQRLLRSAATAKQQGDAARFQRDRDRQRLAEMEAHLATAQLGARSDQVTAATAEVQALEAALTRAQWTFAQKSQRAPAAGFVFDTLFRSGEWVAAGRPVVLLLPPENVKVRAFVPEPQLAALHLGDPVRVWLDGKAEPLRGAVRYLSPRAEYTPPVIYSRDTRAKLVFLVEIGFDAETAATLHPGQPVDLDWGS